MKVVIRKIGNSHGILIPKPMLAESGLQSEAEMSIEDGALILRKPARPPRVGWAEAARKLAGSGDDALALGEFANADDTTNTW